RLAEAQASLERAVELARRVGETRALPLIHTLLAITLVERGERDAARRLVDETMTAAEASELVWLRLEARRATAEWELAYGEPERALAMASECIELLASRDSLQNPLMMGALHAEALARLG